MADPYAEFQKPSAPIGGNPYAEFQAPSSEPEAPDAGAHMRSHALGMAQADMEPRALYADPMPGSRSYSYNPKTSPNPMGSGLTTAAEGVSQIAAPGANNKLGGVHKIVSGLGEAASPALIASGVTAPVSTALGLAGGYGGSKLAHGVAKSLGASDEGADVAGDVGGVVGGGAALKYGKTPITTGVQKLTATDPTVALDRVYSPKGSNKTFTERAPRVTSDINQFGGKVKGNEDLLKAAPQAMGHMDAQLEPYLQNGDKTGATVNGDNIVRDVVKAIPDVVKRKNPTIVQEVQDHLEQAYGGQQIPTRQAMKELSQFNSRMKGFYGRTQATRDAIVNGGLDKALEKAEIDSLRNNTYEALDPNNAGAGPREIQQRKGDIKGVMERATDKRAAIQAEKPASAMEALATPLKAVSRAFKGDVPGALSQLKHPIKGPSDALIKGAFNRGQAEPLPQAPAMSRWQPTAPAGAFKQLSPALNIHAMSGNVAPDTSGPIPSFNLPKGSGVNRLLGPVTATQQPGFTVNQHSGTEQLVPIQLHGKIEYMPKWMADKYK